MTTELREEQLVRDEILYLPVDVIDPDPAQPRLAVDAELADSIAQHGVLQPIQVRPHPVDADRFMIVDGERRWRGATAAKVKTIPAQITLEVEDVGDRLVRQIVRNEGKPLTPVEEAKAFQRIIDERRAAALALEATISERRAAGEKHFGTAQLAKELGLTEDAVRARLADKSYGVVQLAKELGIAKSTVSDRVGMLDIPAFWLDYIVKGPLQASHTPILRRWRLVPEKYQREALQAMKDDLEWPKHSGERIGIDDFDTMLRGRLAKYVKPLSEVRGYEGPTEKGNYEQYVWGSNRNQTKVYAMDPDLWRPLVKEEAKKKSAATRTQNEKKKKITTPRWVKAAIAGGAKLETEKGYGSHHNETGLVGTQQGTGALEWHFGFGYRREAFDPSVLIAKADLAKLRIYRRESSYSPTTYTIITSDTGARGAARKAFLDARSAAYRGILEAVGRELLAAGEAAGRDQLVMGGAAPHLVVALLEAAAAGDRYARKENLEEESRRLLALAIAAQCPGAIDVDEKSGAAEKYLRALSREPAETLLNAIAVLQRDEIKHPVERLEAWEERQLKKYAAIKPTFGTATAADADEEVEDDAPDPAAKTPTPRRRKNAVDEEALNAEATGEEEEISERDDADGPACEYCGCTTLQACELEDGPCSWYSEDPPVCSNPECVDAFHSDSDPVVAESDDVEDLEPAHAGAED